MRIGKSIWLGMMAAAMSLQLSAADITPEQCEALRQGLKAPYYYCPCHLESDTFIFPLDTIVRDTMWFTASIYDVRKGMTAYWFSDDSVKLEVYAYCTDKTPVFEMTLAGNRMSEKDAAEVKQMLDQVPPNLQEALSGLTPHIRVYPKRKNASGRVYCYPYDEGPSSTCADPLPIYPWMTYVLADDEEYVYRMDAGRIPSDGKAFIHWKQRQNRSCEVWLTLGSCDGEEVGRAALSDSLHVFIPDVEMMKSAREQGQALWMHVKHEAGKPGRICYYTSPKFAEPAAPVEKSTCMGKKLTVNGRDYWSDTTFTDTLWVKKDTLQTASIQLSFPPQAMEYDTIRVKESELKFGYRSTTYNITLYAYGDTLIYRAKENTCTRRILLTVAAPTPIEQVADEKRKARKQIINGQLFILMDDKRYDVLGQQIQNTL